MVQVTQQLDKVNTLAARVIVWTYSLLIMVAVATYTGSSPAQAYADHRPLFPPGLKLAAAVRLCSPGSVVAAVVEIHACNP